MTKRLNVVHAAYVNNCKMFINVVHEAYVNNWKTFISP